VTSKINVALEAQADNDRWQAVARAVGEYVGSFSLYANTPPEVLKERFERWYLVVEHMRTGDLPAIEKALRLEVKL
jgi:hypothetical protein